MGKSGKSQRQQRRRRGDRLGRQDDDDPLHSSAYDLPLQQRPPHRDNEEEDEQEEDDDVNEREGKIIPTTSPCKFHLYQRSVQSPKGDISYLLKFFFMYVGRRTPLHLQEDFCGTALLSTEWLHGDPRRTAVGLDLDLEALTWCLDNNLDKIGSDCSSRIFLFHGDVLKPQEALLLPNNRMQDLVRSVNLKQSQGSPNTLIVPCSMKEDSVLPPRDIICAFNYSCCCLQTRSDLLLYFKNAFDALSTRGGIFALDLYGGTSSEHKLRLRRRYPGFTYIWEQADFDVLSHKTKVSLHFQLGKKQMLRHAFSYDWRLWSLPEIKDCLEEVGFRFVHFWVSEMPDSRELTNSEERSDGKYEELTFFQQIDAWNAYVVAVAK